MKHVPIRLGPLALLLTVISICMSTLSMLSYANAQADLRLAQRYAETTRIRYELEKEGQQYLLAYRQGGLPAETVLEKEGYKLHILLNGQGEPLLWKIEREWEETTEIPDLWEGE